MNCMSLKKYIAKAMILALLKEKDTDGYEIALETARYTNFPKRQDLPSASPLSKEPTDFRLFPKI